MSGIYIPMEMPTNCWQCFARTDVNIGVGVADGCNLIKAMISNLDERLPDCPLVPVPEHGPLVDALDVIRTFPDEFVFTNEQAGALTNYIIPADPAKEGEG